MLLVSLFQHAPWASCTTYLPVNSCLADINRLTETFTWRPSVDCSCQWLMCCCQLMKSFGSSWEICLKDEKFNSSLWCCLRVTSGLNTPWVETWDKKKTEHGYNIGPFDIPVWWCICYILHAPIPHMHAPTSSSKAFFCIMNPLGIPLPVFPDTEGILFCRNLRCPKATLSIQRGTRGAGSNDARLY